LLGEVRVVSTEGLIGLKIQAFNNPRRTQDLEDIKALIIAANRQALKMDEVREYFRLFNREALLEEIIKCAYLPITDNRLPPMAVSLMCLRLQALIHPGCFDNTNARGRRSAISTADKSHSAREILCSQ
jgi:hypothetical protein